MYKVFRLEDKSLWRESFSSLPLNQRDIYYTPEYYSLYEKNGDGRACCFVYEENGECVLYPFLINSVNELGYELDGEYFDIQGAYGYNGMVSLTVFTSVLIAFVRKSVSLQSSLVFIPF